jgi:hypothetical protein
MRRAAIHNEKQGGLSATKHKPFLVMAMVRPISTAEVQTLAGSVVKPDHWFSRQESQLLMALLYLVQAEAGGAVETPLLQCRKILRNALIKAAGRSIRGKPGNVLWVLLARFKAAHVAKTLPPEGWDAWLDASRIPEALVRFTVPG